ncbi:MAG TPA: SEC-C metal-binding domain-containing protein [Gemmatimonadales bacterium]|nr:SEC-C metal-binding domain-containing protein [Gemmatimonadales bacterium]
MKPPRLRLVPSQPGRNAPCPCGSGRRYRLCHGKPTAKSKLSPAARFHAVSHELSGRLLAYGDALVGPPFLDFLDDYAPDDPMLPFIVTMRLFHEPIDDKSLIEWAIAEPTFTMSPLEEAVLLAEDAAHLSIWEVLDVVPGQHLLMRDLLTGAERRVLERTASATLTPRLAVLARVVDYQGVSVFTGLYPGALPPVEATAVVQEMRRKLRRTRDIPAERLRPFAITLHLFQRWEDEVELLHQRPPRMPEIRNIDGDEMLLTTDHFAVQADDRAQLAHMLRAIPDLEAPADDDPDGDHVFLSSEGHTVHGVLRMTTAGFVLETNSRARADRLRAVLEQTVGSLVRHRAREHPSHLPDPDAPVRAPEIPDDVQRAILQEFIDTHYREWLDIPVPALDGRTPRDAARSPAGRAAVDLLLKEIEHRSGQGPMPVSPDFAAMRQELGME